MAVLLLNAPMYSYVYKTYRIESALFTRHRLYVRECKTHWWKVSGTKAFFSPATAASSATSSSGHLQRIVSVEKTVTKDPSAEIRYAIHWAV